MYCESSGHVTWIQNGKVYDPNISEAQYLDNGVRNRRLFQAECIQKTIYCESSGHVTDDITCPKWQQFKAGCILGANSSGKMLPNEG